MSALKNNPYFKTYADGGLSSYFGLLPQKAQQSLMTGIDKIWEAKVSSHEEQKRQKKMEKLQSPDQNVAQGRSENTEGFFAQAPEVSLPPKKAYKKRVAPQPVQEPVVPNIPQEAVKATKRKAPVQPQQGELAMELPAVVESQKKKPKVKAPGSGLYYCRKCKAKVDATNVEKKVSPSGNHILTSGTCVVCKGKATAPPMKIKT